MSQALARASVEELLDALARQEARQGKIHTLFPETGPYRRGLYKQHMHFFEAGLYRTARLAMCANGVGKTLAMGGFEIACHLTGQYPDWWPGFKYRKPPRFWVAGQTRQTTRDNQQAVLLGRPNVEQEGGGLIPTDCIDLGSLRRWPQGGGLIESVRIKHISGGHSYLGVRSYDQNISAWYGENLDGGWMDEPAEAEYYSELYTRTRGSERPNIMLTFTPLKGANDLVLLFTEEPDESREVISCTWDDVPHLSEQWKRDKLANTPPYMRDTVSKGIPALGVGAVYPVPESEFVIPPIEIPDYWPRCFGFDGGWHNTAAVWGAYDRSAETWYLYSEHKAGHQPIPIHAAAIKARGEWIQGVGDAYATNQSDGEAIIDQYRDAGIKLFKAPKQDKESRIEKVRQGLMEGRIKVFSTLTNWLSEYRLYHYDDRGKLVKQNDHLMDASQHLIDVGPRYMKTRTVAESTFIPEKRFGRRF